MLTYLLVSALTIIPYVHGAAAKVAQLAAAVTGGIVTPRTDERDRRRRAPMPALRPPGLGSGVESMHGHYGIQRGERAILRGDAAVVMP